MGRPRFEKLDQAKRNKLLESAAAEFAEKGFEGASLNRILERSGMSKSSLYYYFEDKADLFTTLVERSVGFLFREIGSFDLQALTRENFWSECEAFYGRCVELVSRDAWYVKLGRMFYRLRADRDGGGPTERMFDIARNWIAGFVRRGQELGVIRTDMPESVLIDSALAIGEALDRWVVANWDSLDEPARRRMPAEHVGMFRRLLAPEDTATAAS